MPRLIKKFYSFDEAIEDFMIDCTNKNLSKKTMKSYESTIKLFSKYCEEELNKFIPSAITTKDIKEYLEFTKERGKYSFISRALEETNNNPSARGDFGKQVSLYTVNNYLRNIKVFYSYLMVSNKIQTNPTVTLKEYKHSRKPKDEVTAVDFNKLLKSLDLTLYAEYRDYVIIQMIYDTGMRIGELLSLTDTDILLDKKAIYIRAEISKGKKDRYVFFGISLQKILRRWLNYKDRYFNTDLVFPSVNGNLLGVTNFEKNMKKYSNRANVKVTAHQLRNNFGRRYLLSGGDIFTLSKILGHSSVNITQQYYLDITAEQINKKYQKFSPLDNMK